MEPARSSNVLHEDTVLMLEQFSCAILLIDSQGQVIYSNPALSKLLPPAPETASVLQHLGDLCAEPEMLRALALGSAPHAVLTLNDGRAIAIDVTPLGDNVLWQLRDVTESARIEKALRQSEEKLHAILENIEDGYYEVDLSGNFTLVNDGFARILGYPQETITALETRRYSHYTDAANADKVRGTFQEVYRSGLPGRVEGTIIRPHGSLRFVDISVSLMRDAQGIPQGFHGIVRDVTDRRRVEQALSKRMTLLSIMQTVDMELSQTLSVEHVLAVSLNASVLLSEAETAYIGLIEAGQISLKQSFGAYANIPHLDVNLGITRRVIHRQQAELVLDVERDPDYYAAIPATRAQMTIPLLSHETLLGILNLETADPSRFSPEVFEFLQLLTARMAAALDNARLHEISQAQLAELRDLEQLKTDIIRVASHDIRSPLSVVSGYLNMLADDLGKHLTDEHRFFFDAMFSAIRRMQHMANDILSLDRVQSSHGEAETIVFLNDILRKSLLDVREEARLKKLTLHPSIPDEPLPVYGSDTDLNEAMVNLLNNAIKYTPEGGRIEARLHILPGETRDWGVLEVEDNGIGIAEEHQARLFQPFYRVKTRETHQIDGVGLGLYVVKKLVEFHGGSMHFHSSAGQGSVFGFQIPLARRVEA